MMGLAPWIVWFRRDLRLCDNPALAAAVRSRSPVVAAFIASPKEDDPWFAGDRSQSWLRVSLDALAKSLHERGSRLIVRVGAAHTCLAQLAAETGCSTVVWNSLCEPNRRTEESRVVETLGTIGVAGCSYDADVLRNPGTVLTNAGGSYSVFTPFYRAFLRMPPLAEPLSTPRTLQPPVRWPDTADGKTIFGTRAQRPILSDWQPGEAGGIKRVRRFKAESLSKYENARDVPGTDGISRLSPHLHFGEISTRQLWHALQDVPGSGSYLRQLVWRDFARHILFHKPSLPEQPMRKAFSQFPWQPNARQMQAWEQGRTGYPLVDAGMRELLATGFMHNRVRMVVASFLVKHLLQPWQAGARWFWEQLYDADLANNTMGWQWVAGCGPDAAPYFRVFNPVLQGEKFDADGAYVRTWIPELAEVSARWLHQPWNAPTKPKGYPGPIVDHAAARARALAAYATIRD
jgi:deoxyribodipyrimidine photo-lyase